MRIALAVTAFAAALLPPATVVAKPDPNGGGYLFMFDGSSVILRRLSDAEEEKERSRQTGIASSETFFSRKISAAELRAERGWMGAELQLYQARAPVCRARVRQ